MIRGIPHVLASVALVAVTIPSAASAQTAAQPAAPPSQAAQPVGASPDATVDQASPLPEHSLVWHPWRLFDPHLSRRELVFSGGVVSEHAVNRAGARGGIDASFGPTIETRIGLFIVRLAQEYALRQTRDGEWAIAVPRYTYAGGLLIGPLELTARAGLSLAEVSFGAKGFGLAFFSPIVGAGASVRIGPVRVGALAYSELAWRWLDQPTLRVTGALLEVGLQSHSSDLPSYYRVEK
jgi:hypothetical protein